MDSVGLSTQEPSVPVALRLKLGSLYSVSFVIRSVSMETLLPLLLPFLLLIMIILTLELYLCTFIYFALPLPPPPPLPYFRTAYYAFKLNVATFYVFPISPSIGMV